MRLFSTDRQQPCGTQRKKNTLGPPAVVKMHRRESVPGFSSVVFIRELCMERVHNRREQGKNANAHIHFLYLILQCGFFFHAELSGDTSDKHESTLVLPFLGTDLLALPVRRSMPLALLLMAGTFLAFLSLPRFSWPMTEAHGQTWTQPACESLRS